MKKGYVVVVVVVVVVVSNYTICITILSRSLVGRVQQMYRVHDIFMLACW